MSRNNLDIITTTEEMTDFSGIGRVKMQGMMPYLIVWIPDENVFNYIDIELLQIVEYTTTSVTRVQECTDKDFVKFANISIDDQKEYVKQETFT